MRAGNIIPLLAALMILVSSTQSYCPKVKASVTSVEPNVECITIQEYGGLSCSFGEINLINNCKEDLRIYYPFGGYIQVTPGCSVSYKGEPIGSERTMTIKNNCQNDLMLYIQDPSGSQTPLSVEALKKGDEASYIQEWGRLYVRHGYNMSTPLPYDLKSGKNITVGRWTNEWNRRWKTWSLSASIRDTPIRITGISQEPTGADITLALLLIAAFGLIGYSNRDTLAKKFLKKSSKEIGCICLIIAFFSITLLLVLQLGVG